MSLLLLSGCNDGEPSTGAAKLEVLGSQYRYRSSNDPDDEILRLTHSGAMSGVVTTFSLHGDGRLVWRWMAQLAPGSPKLEMFEGLHVTRRVEGRLSADEMAELISIPVNYDLATTTTWDLLRQMGVSTWQKIDAGSTTLACILKDVRNGAFRLAH